MKEEILAFLYWLEGQHRVSLCYLEGYATNFYTSYEEINDLIDEFINSQEALSK